MASTLPRFARQFQGVHAPLEDERELGKLLRAALNGAGDLTADEPGKRRPVKLTDSPFVGLRAMTEADADVFFGREAEVKALVDTVRANRLLTVVADSGAGKSSLVMTGLIPRVRGGSLQEKWVSDQPVWQVVLIRPGGDPVEKIRVPALHRTQPTAGARRRHARGSGGGSIRQDRRVGLCAAVRLAGQQTETF